MKMNGLQEDFVVGFHDETIFRLGFFMTDAF